MLFFVEIKLFENNGGAVSCFKLAKRLDDTNAKNPEIRGLLSKLAPETIGETPSNSEQIRLDKIRLEEKENKTNPPSPKFIPPTQDELITYFAEKGHPKSEADKFFYFYDSKGWMVGKNKMKKWKSSVGSWMAKNEPKESAQSGDFI